MEIGEKYKMAEVKILVKGYFLEDYLGGKACSTVSLVKDKDIIMVVDPGTTSDQKVIVNSLKKEGFSIKDVNWVCITHSHMDHYRNIGMFPEAKVLDYWGIWEGDKEAIDWEENFTENIRILKTPGHDYSCISLLVKTDKGKVAIVGDVFWKENLPIKDPYASDNKKLKESRRRILEIADYIIPGHGEMFKVQNHSPSHNLNHISVF